MLLFFFLIFVGVNITFFPLHFSGLQGYPRKYLDYRDLHGLWNGFSSLGSVLSGFALMVFIYMVIFSRYSTRLFVYDEKSSSNLESVFGGYVGFHGYRESVGFYVNIEIVYFNIFNCKLKDLSIEFFVNFSVLFIFFNNFVSLLFL
jgi:hypothetical protein